MAEKNEEYESVRLWKMYKRIMLRKTRIAIETWRKKKCEGEHICGKRK